jgi:hypothetical protein
MEPMAVMRVRAVRVGMEFEDKCTATGKIRQ